MPDAHGAHLQQKPTNRESRRGPHLSPRNELPLTIAQNGCGCVLIFRASNALAYFLLPRPLPSSRPPRPTCGGCWPASVCTGPRWDPSGPSFPTTSRPSNAPGARPDVHASFPRSCRTLLQPSPASGLTPARARCSGGAGAALTEADRSVKADQPWQVQRRGP